MNYLNKKRQVKAPSAIHSAALQDHMLRKFNLGLDFGVKVIKNQPIKRKTLEKLPSLKRVDKQIVKLETAEKTSILPYQSEALKKLKEEKSDNQKMMRYNKKLTWAQRLGIIQAPPKPLTAEDWENIEQKSKARNDSQNCCSICLQDFRIEPQAILSCSHVFHLQCLKSYEKHNQARCCPICRRRDYQQKVTDEAIRAFTLKSILRIQRVLRGSRTRIKLYSKLIESEYSAKSARFNRRLIGFKMWKLSRRITEKVKKSQQYFEGWLNKIKIQNDRSQEQILDQMVEVQRGRKKNEEVIAQYLKQFGLGVQEKKQQKIDWQSVRQKGVNRKEEDCAICLAKLQGRPVCLLSCSHMFHANCIEGLERYSLPGNQNRCPCCRSEYSKRLMREKK